MITKARGGHGRDAGCRPRAARSPPWRPSGTRRARPAGCMMSVSCQRARDTRAFIVPTGTPQIDAASSCVSSWAPTSTSASRSSGGSDHSVRCRSRRLGRVRLVRPRRLVHGSLGAQRGRLAPAPARLLEEQVAQDGEQPGLEVGARTELRQRAQRAHHRVLHQVVGRGAVPHQEARERAQVRQQRQHVAAQVADRPVVRRPRPDVARRRRCSHAAASVPVGHDRAYPLAAPPGK